MNNAFQPSQKAANNTALAQQQMNEQAAQKSQTMSMVDQYTPYGSLTYEPIGDYNGTQRWSATTNLSPNEQRIEDFSTNARSNLAETAASQSDFLKHYLSQGVDTSGAPALQSAYQASGLNGYNSNYSADYGQNYNQQFSGDVGGGYNTGFSQNVGGGYDTNYARDIGGGYNTGFSGDLGGNYNQQFSGDIGGGYDTGFNRNIGGSYSDTLGDGFTTGVDLQKQYNTDFSDERNQVENALMQRLQPQQQQDEGGLRNQLIQSGLRPGTAAWNSEMDRLQRGVNDQRLAVVANAGQEQTRLVNMARDAAGFYNDATLAQAGFGNDALSQQFQQQNQAALNSAQFGQNAQLAQNNSALGQAQFGQNAQLAQNAAAYQAWQAQQSAQLNQNNAALGQAQFGSQQQTAQNQAAMGQAQFGSQQQINQNAAAMGQAQFGSQQQQLQNDAAYQQWMGQQAAQQAQNEAVMGQANYSNNAQLTAAQLANDARGQYMQEAYAARNQPINEINALMAGSQVNQPNFVNTPQANMQAAQIGQATPNPVGSGIFQLGAAAIGAGGRIAGR